MDKIFKVTNKGSGRAEVLLYSEIGGYFGVSSSEFVQEISALKNVAHVDFRVSSEGGSVIDAIDMFNAIRRHPAKWEAHIDGLAASAASWLVLATNKVHMAENAQYMIHRATSPAYGNADELRKMASLIEDIEQTSMINAYMAKTGLDSDKIMDMLDDETWMTADKAKDYGFVDEITETLQMAASARLSGRYAYAHAPESLTGKPIISDSAAPILQAAKLRRTAAKSL